MMNIPGESLWLVKIADILSMNNLRTTPDTGIVSIRMSVSFG